MVEGTFPRQISLGRRTVGWLENEVQEWLERQIENNSEWRAKSKRTSPTMDKLREDSCDEIATVSLSMSSRNPPKREDKYFQEPIGDCRDLRRVRRDLQLSQEALARRLGMTRNPVAEWKRTAASARYIELAIAGAAVKIRECFCQYNILKNDTEDF